jgi:hypothetical protein
MALPDLEKSLSPNTNSWSDGGGDGDDDDDRGDDAS